MNRYHLRIITGYGNVCDAGLESFTVDANNFNYGSSGCYVFYRDNGSIVASFPIDRTIILKIEKI